jgi:hypothetical protein
MADAEDSFERDRWADPSLMSVELVMRAWRQLVRGLEPWRSMAPDDRGGELRRVLEELLDPLGGNSPVRRRRILVVATRHGTFRRAQRCSESTLVNDFVVLRRAVSRALRAHGVGRVAVRECARALRPDIQFARRAARAAHAEAYGRFEGG